MIYMGLSDFRWDFAGEFHGNFYGSVQFVNEEFTLG